MKYEEAAQAHHTTAAMRFRSLHPEVLEILLFDQTTKKNILWATDNYEHLGKGFEKYSQIRSDLITGANGNVIQPYSKKDKKVQHNRTRDMAEVFTPSWICNAQNNLIDNAWFGYDNAFNSVHIKPDGSHMWKTNSEKIFFPKDKSWQDYVKNTRLEISCGEAPYLASRYDTTTGVFISVANRIGILDRKLRIVNENVDTIKDWLKATENAFKSIYAFEWHGDSMLLARESLLLTFIENHINKFEKEPNITSIKTIAHVISWNIWQMDGLKFVVPDSCTDRVEENLTFFEETEEIRKPCEGCAKNDIRKHNGIYCRIMDWNENETVKFIDIGKVM